MDKWSLGFVPADPGPAPPSVPALPLLSLEEENEATALPRVRWGALI